MKSKRIAAILLALVMLLGMLPAGMATTTECQHIYDWRYPEGEAKDCLEAKPIEMYCTICGYIASSYDQLGPHDEGEWYWDGDKPQNCMEYGIQNCVCKRCGEVCNERETFGDHQMAVKTIDATCTESGWKVPYCTYCNVFFEENDEEIPALGHDWGEDVVEYAATCMQHGTVSHTCRRCGEKESWETPLGDHQMAVKIIDATCTESGWKVPYCTYCNVFFEENDEEIPALGHDWGEEVLESAATCLQPGVKSRTCRRCGLKESWDTDYGSHDWSDWTVTEGSSCTDPGERKRTCHRCGKEQAEALEPTDHKWADWFVTKEGTCIEVGEKVRYCSRCGIDQMLYTDYGDHAFGEWYLVRAAAVGVTGLEERKCSLCGLTEQRETPALEAAAEALLKVEIALDNAPANGTYFVPGEKVYFHYYATNASDAALYSVKASFMDDMGPQASVTADEMQPGATVEGVYEITVTDVNASNGAYYAFAMAKGLTEKQQEVLGESEAISVPCGVDEAPVTYDGPIAQLEKYVKNVPANGEYFVEGETIEYAVVFMNCVAHDLYDVEVADPLKGNNEDAVLAREPVVAREGTLHLSFNYVVTAQDVARGYVENTASAVWTNPEINEQGACASNTVVTTVGAGEDAGAADTPDTDAEGLLLIKSVVNSPANGMFFVPGEMISFEVKAVNKAGVSLNNVNVYDPLTGGFLGGTHMLTVDQYLAFYPSVFVTEMDAAHGTLVNCAYVTADDEAGTEYLEYSNFAVVPCGFADAPYGVIESAAIVKKEESLPANGLYYTEGEVIHYSITYANDGEMPINNVSVHEAKGGLDELATAEMLQPGESRICYYEHTVTAEDVARGYVENYATCVYQRPGGEGLCIVTSNTVYSDTDGKEDPVPAPGGAAPGADGTVPGGTAPGADGTAPGGAAPGADGTIPGSMDPITDIIIGKDDNGRIDSSKLAQGADHCKHVITARDGNSVAYENSFCAMHGMTQDMIQTMASVATDAATQQQAWEYGITLWQADIKAMYEALIDAADAQAHMSLIDEYVTFYGLMANREVTLRTVYADQPQEVARLLCEMWRDKAISLCSEMNTAPAAREDSLLLVAQSAGAQTAGSACDVLTANETAQGYTATQISCPAHSFLFGMMDKLLKGESTAAGWQRIYQLWNSELSKAYNKLGAALGEEERIVLMLERSMLEKWLSCRTAMLTALYPDHPEICAEVITTALMNYVADLCRMGQ